MDAFSRALALESIPEELAAVDPLLLYRYAKTVAYKVAGNLERGARMDPLDNPLIQTRCTCAVCNLKQAH